MGAIISYNPCFGCQNKKMCTMCELAQHRSGMFVWKWIPVAERLPTAEDAVHGHVYAFSKDAKTGGEWPYESIRRHPDWFTHRARLPESPEEVD